MGGDLQEHFSPPGVKDETAPGCIDGVADVAEVVERGRFRGDRQVIRTPEIARKDGDQVARRGADIHRFPIDAVDRTPCRPDELFVQQGIDSFHGNSLPNRSSMFTCPHCRFT